MMNSNEQQGSQNTYIFDQESAAEMGRLLLQNRLINEAMEGYFPEREDALAGMSQVLDVGCGPGEWALGAARTYPHLTMTGIDISELMIAYARVQAQREAVQNVRFGVMNALERLAFPDGYFDLVNIRAAVAWIPRARWADVLRECVRVVRPGGTVRLTEFDIALTNKPVCEQEMRLVTRLIARMGYGFSPDGFTFGITPMLGRLLMDAGCGRVRYQLYAIDYSSGTPLHPIEFQNAIVGNKQLQPLLVKAGLARQEELDRMYIGFQEEMQAEDFRAIMYWMTAWAEKPKEG